MDNQTILEKEIDLIQACISRMAQNSFSVKGWLITLVTVILALLPETVNVRILCGIVLAATLCFWYLDAFFLRLEKLYRWKYEWVIANRKETNEFCYDLNPMNTQMWAPDKDGNQRNAPNVVKVMFTKSLIPLYSIVIITCIIFLVSSFFSFEICDIFKDILIKTNCCNR